MERISEADPVEVRFYPRDGSVFLDTHYLIKGVAGAIFWKLAREYALYGRSEFSLRELRLAGNELRLPEVQDNLSVRMLLLQRRLAERGAAMQIHKTARGRFRIELRRPLRLREMVERRILAEGTPALNAGARVGVREPEDSGSSRRVPPTTQFRDRMSPNCPRARQPAQADRRP